MPRLSLKLGRFRVAAHVVERGSVRLKSGRAASDLFQCRGGSPEGVPPLI